MAELTGTPQYVVNTAHGNSSQALTIPADCTAVLVFSWGFAASTALDFTALNWDGGGLDFTQVVTNKSTSDPYDVWAYIMTSADGNWPGTGSQTLNWTFNSTPGEGGTVVVVYLKDVDTASPVVDTDSAKAGATFTSSMTGVAAGDLSFVVVVDFTELNGPSATGTGQTTLVSNIAGDNSVEWVIAYEDGESAMQAQGNPDWNVGLYTGFIAFSIANGAAPATLEQEGFAFGDDDGSESGHTLGTQDSNATAEVAATKTLRLLIDATSDPASTAYALRYQKNGAGGYTAVPTSSGGKTQPVIEAGDCTESGDNATTPSSPWSVSRPTAVSGDLLILVIGWDDSTNNTGITVANGPNGEVWSQINSVVASASTEVRMTAYYVVATGSWGAGSISVTPAANEQWTATVIRVPAGEFDAATPIGASATRASAGTAETNALSPAMTAGASDGSGTLIFAVTTDTDPLTTLQSGYSSIANTDRGNEALGVAVRDTAVSNSESIAGGDTWALASDSWCSIAFVVRAPTVTNEIYITPSANVAAGGEATTARLTAPSGKTTGDFATGRRWDDENGSDSIDIGADQYTELEWVLTTQSPAAVDDYYEFRVYAGAAALDTYTVTPRLTLISGSSPVTVTPGTAAATLTAVSPTAVQGDVAITPGNAPLALAGLNPTAVLGSIATAPNAATLSLTAVSPIISLGAEVATPGVAQLALTAVSPATVLASLTLTPGAAIVTLAAVSPTVVAASISLAPGTAALTLAAVSPAVLLASLNLTPAAATLALAAASPTVALGGLALAPGAASLALASVNPTVGEGALLVTPGVGLVQLAAINPTAVLGSVTAQPGAALAHLVATNPAVSSGALLVNGGAAAVALAGVNPTAVLGSVTAVPGAALVTLAAVNPTAVQGDIALAVAAALVNLTAVSPTVPSFESVTVTPAAALVQLAAVDPTVAILAVLLLRLRPRTFDPVMAGRDFDLALRPRSFDLRLEDW